MSLVFVFISILVLILLITWLKFNPFLAFLISSILAGFLLGIPPEQIAGSIQKGIGGLLGDLVIVIVMGAMLGKLVAESGAAQKISDTLMSIFGIKNVTWAMMVTGLVVGIPLFYNVGFVLLVPLVFTISYRYKLPAVYVGIPLLAALSVTHGFLPPHPSPAALVAQFGANMGLTLVYGLIIVVPTIIIAGPIFAKFLKNIDARPLDTFLAKPKKEEDLPGTFNSFFSALFPVFLLIGTTTLMLNMSADHWLFPYLKFVGDPGMVMLISLLIATYTIGLRMKFKIPALMDIYVVASKDVAMILLIIAGAGALKQVLLDSGVSQTIADSLQGWDVDPLILAWTITAIIRVCVGSATVAGLTTAGIIAPMVSGGVVDPNLLVLSIGAGSLMFSHFNDAGFWLYKEYFNVSVKDTLKSWSLMETIVAVVGLGGVMLLDAFI
ncbi:Gnt-I system high-affinity gluconate transporter [Aquiflexum balticum DSM 16537]|uniref:Gnt-I system high-affinity gluconate transporter n=1 Tax=Aquiflexum balticum DSM 16537 TaxID=758820 RepID=A0A1W2H0F0_9BACT|nr:gluconate:H+ symporter [Aquiflexum balticum]SMD42373.1 Gnt-I system high-affinity gluconate transporter [Aquiflexum balticum DSM 16537]